MRQALSIVTYVWSSLSLQLNPPSSLLSQICLPCHEAVFLLLPFAVLWDVYGDCKNYGVLKGHTNAVTDVQWSADSGIVYSASADKSVGVWDAKVIYAPSLLIANPSRG